MNRRNVLALFLGLVIVLGVAWAVAGEMGPGEFKADYKTSGEFFTMMDGMKMGKSPHGKVQIWYSNDLKDMIGKAKFTAPVGAVSIKPFEMGVKKGIAVMVKKEAGYDPENGDWYYEMRMPDGKIQEAMGKPMAGKIGMCIKCHAVAAAKDYLAGTQMR
ncbi:MAG: cytochrome P460 family protein [Candidatus Lernaella stagnicola]|nr:cytochrome P460 family protein [Candidatus Lernaella stagnicola]